MWVLYKIVNSENPRNGHGEMASKLLYLLCSETRLDRIFMEEKIFQEGESKIGEILDPSDVYITIFRNSIRLNSAAK